MSALERRLEAVERRMKTRPPTEEAVRREALSRCSEAELELLELAALAPDDYQETVRRHWELVEGVRNEFAPQA